MVCYTLKKKKIKGEAHNTASILHEVMYVAQVSMCSKDANSSVF